MQGKFDTIELEVNKNHPADSLVETYKMLLSGTMVRTSNVLSAWQQKFPDISQFVKYFVNASYLEIKNLKNCGRLTVDEILKLQQSLRSLTGRDLFSCDVDNVEDSVLGEIIISHPLPSNIDKIFPLFMSTISGLSSRSEDIINWLLEDCDKSISSFYSRICNPNYINSIPISGSRFIREIRNFISKARIFIEQFQDEESVISRMKHYYLTSPSVLGFSDEVIEQLQAKEKSLGYFPIFAAIQYYLNNRPEEQKILIDGTMLIHKGQQLPNKDEVRAMLNLSGERIRQKRNFLVEQFQDYFKLFSNLGFITKNPYSYQMVHYEDNVNLAEGTDFNLNFISLVLGSVFDELAIIGNPIKSLCGYFETKNYLCLVPAKLVSFFDFEGFIKNLENNLQVRRMGEEKLCLKSLINSCLKIQNCEELMFEIETACRSILYLHFPVKVDQEYVTLPSNAYKTNQFILEGFLRATGRPMTLDELIERYKLEYPEREVKEGSLRSSLTSNVNVVPIGRSSTYTLAEWDRCELRGGTIRSFVQEFIDSIPKRIASTAAVTDYVIKFRPDTNEKNILSNISLESHKTFAFFYKDGERFIGYSDRVYPLDYFPGGNAFITAITNSIYYPKILKFVEDNYRYPSANGSLIDERRLNLFWIRQKTRYKNNELDDHARAYFEKIESVYRHLNVESTDPENNIDNKNVTRAELSSVNFLQETH